MERESERERERARERERVERERERERASEREQPHAATTDAFRSTLQRAAEPPRSLSPPHIQTSRKTHTACAVFQRKCSAQTPRKTSVTCWRESRCARLDSSCTSPGASSSPPNPSLGCAPPCICGSLRVWLAPVRRGCPDFLIFRWRSENQVEYN